MAVKAMMQTDYFLGIWGRGLSKCSEKSSLIHTLSGTKKIIDVEVGEEVLAKNGICKVLSKTVNHKQKTYRLTSQKGYESEGLDYHRVLILNEDLETEWKFAKDIKEGDVMVMRKNGYESKQIDILKDFKNKKVTNPNSLKLNPYGASLSDWYYFFGLFIGDGNFRPNAIDITSEDAEIIDFMVRFSTNIGLSCKVYDLKNKPTTKKISIYSVQLLKFLKSLGFNPSLKAKDKILPYKILACSKENAAACLRGLFDTDGYASCQENKEKNAKSVIAGFTSSSYELIKQVRMLMLLIGIVTKTGVCFKGGNANFNGRIYKFNKAWSLIVTSQDNVIKFKEKIGFSILRKKKVIDIVDDYKYQNNEFSEYIPYIGSYLEKKYKRKSFCKKTGSAAKLKFRKNTSKTLARKILESGRLTDSDYYKISQLVNKDLFFDQAVKVEEHEAVTVDIQVENEHCYMSDGFINHNSFTTGLYAVMDAIMNQGVQIGIISKTFRQAKMIFKKIEDIARSPKAEFLSQCITKVSRQNDEWTMEIGASKIIALPLGDGEKLRGFRFQRMIIDELLLMPEKVLNEVITPFLSIVENPQERQQIYDVETKLINQGKMKEEERKIWPNNKIIGLSSASYKFEHLYKMYQQYENSILGNKQDGAHRVIMHYSYECAPSQLYDKTLISQAKASLSESQFDREFRSIFTDDSSGYFKVSKMAACTIQDGEGQCVEVKADPNSQYILNFDPSWSESEGSDDFAMNVIKIHPETKKGVVVHSYGVAGAALKKHISYFAYLIETFKPEMIIGDYNGGLQFINSCKESSIFKKKKLKLGVIDSPDIDDPKTYNKGLRKLKRDYNKEEGNYVFLRKPSSTWIRNANESLQAAFDHKRLFFAGAAMDDDFKRQRSSNIPIEDIEFQSGKTEKEENYNSGAKMLDLVEHLREMMDVIKVQCALIEVKTSPQGTQSFDLPLNLKKQQGANKARKDSYSALVLGNWGMNLYFDMIDNKVQETTETFTPMFIG